MITAKRKMSEEEAYEILKRGKYGVLSVADHQATPYGVPLNYFYVKEDHALYFHGLVKGRKTDYLRENNKAAFVVVDMEKVMPERFVTHYDSVMVEGEITFIETEEEKREKMIQLCNKFAPGMIEKRDSIMQRELRATVVLKLNITSVVGKKNRDD